MEYYIGRVRYDLWPNVGHDVCVVLIDAENKAEAELKLHEEINNTPKGNLFVSDAGLAYLGRRDGSPLVKKLQFDNIRI